MGQKFAVFDTQGFPKAFYDDEVHKNIPPEAIPISEQDWLEFINNQGKRKWNFSTNKIEVYTPPSPTKIELIEQLRTAILSLQRQRLHKVLSQYGYNSLGDVQLYASQNDPEAQAILNFYTNANSNGYDDLIWAYIDSLPNKTKADILNDLQDLIAVEENIFQQAVQNNPLP